MLLRSSQVSLGANTDYRFCAQLGELMGDCAQGKESANSYFEAANYVNVKTLFETIRECSKRKF